VDPFILHLFAALAEKERALISRRTKDALAVAKARGVQLGNPELAAANRAAARERAEALRPVLMELRDLSANAAAIELNRRGVPRLPAASGMRRLYFVCASVYPDRIDAKQKIQREPPLENRA